MADKINLPYFGETDLMWVGIVGVGTVGLIGAIWWRAHMKKTATQKKSTPQDVIVAGQTGVDPAGNHGVIDPATGYVYGSDQDMERLGELAVEEYANVVYYPPQGVPDMKREHSHDEDKGDKDKGGDKGKFGPVNNQLWLQTSISGLSSEYEQAPLTAALTKALAGADINVNERMMFMAAVHAHGSPPEGYPPLRVTDTNAQPEPKPETQDSSAGLDMFSPISWGA